MQDSIIQDLEQALSKQQANEIILYLHLFLEYLDILDAQEKQRRIKKIIEADCALATCVKDLCGLLSDTHRIVLLKIIFVFQVLITPSIDFRSQNLYRLGRAGVVRLIYELRGTNVTAMNLSSNKLDTLGADALIHIFLPLPLQVKQMQIDD